MSCRFGCRSPPVASCWSACLGSEPGEAVDCSSATTRSLEGLSGASCLGMSAAGPVCIAHVSRRARPDRMGANPATSPSSLACKALQLCCWITRARGLLTPQERGKEDSTGASDGMKLHHNSSLCCPVVQWSDMTFNRILCQIQHGPKTIYSFSTRVHHSCTSSLLFLRAACSRWVCFSEALE